MYDKLLPGKLICLCVLFAITYYVNFKSTILREAGIAKYLFRCYKKCESDGCKSLITAGKGSSSLMAGETRYGLGPMKDRIGCMMSGWEISHFIYHMFLGYFLNSIYLSTAVGIGFEIYEQKYYEIGSVFDIIWNTAGALAGVGLRRLCPINPPGL